MQSDGSGADRGGGVRLGAIERVAQAIGLPVQRPGDLDQHRVGEVARSGLESIRRVGLVVGERVGKRLRGLRRAVTGFYQRNGKNADVRLIGQHQRPGTLRNIQRVLEEVAVFVRFVPAALVAVRGVPGHRGRFDEAGQQAVEGVAPVVGQLGHGALPQTVVPLADVAAPILHVEGCVAWRGRIGADELEGDGPVSIDGSREQRDVIVVAAGKPEDLAVAGQRVFLAVGGGSELEGNALADDRPGQHLGGKGAAIGIESAVRAVGPRADHVLVEGQRERRGCRRFDPRAGRVEFEGEGAHAKGGNLNREQTPLEVSGRRVRERAFLSVDGTRGHDGRGKPEVGRLCSLAADFAQAHDGFVTILCLFDRYDFHLRVVQRGQGKRAAQGAGMRRCRERAQGLVEPVRARHDAALLPAARVAGHGVGDVVPSEVLRALVLVAAARARRVEQGQAHGVVVGLIRAELAVVEHAHAVAAVLVGQVEPFVLGHLVLLGFVVAAQDHAHFIVIGRQRIARR